MITWISTGSYTDQYPASFGGIQTGEFSVVEEIARLGLAKPVYIVTLKQGIQKSEEQYSNGKIRVFRVQKPYTFKESTDTQFRTAFGIKAKEIAHKQLVQHKSSLFQLCSAVSGRTFLSWDMNDSFPKNRRPVFVYSIHNALALTNKPTASYVSKVDDWRIQKEAELYCIRNSHKSICTSEWFRRNLIEEYGLDSNRIVYLPNTVGRSERYEKISTLKDGQWKKTILYLGRLAPEKGIDKAIRVFKYLLDQGKKYSLVIAGEGSQKDALIKQTKELRIKISNELPPEPGTVHFLGLITGDNKWKIFKSSRTLISLSDYEVSPLVGYEGLALGVPMVVSDIPQWREIVVDAHNGFNIQLGDVKSIGESIKTIIESDALYKKFFHNNVKRYKDKFDARIVAKKRWELIYEPFLRTKTGKYE